MESSICNPENGCGIDEIAEFQIFFKYQYKTVYEYSTKRVRFEGNDNPMYETCHVGFATRNDHIDVLEVVLVENKHHHA